MNIKYIIVIIGLLLYSCSSEESFSSPESSWIEGASYNTETQIMTLQTDDQEYTFKDVPADVWEEFKNASSKGEYYHRNIKGKYHL